MKYIVKLYLAGLGEKTLVFEDVSNDKKGMTVTHVSQTGTSSQKEIKLGRISKDDLKRLARSL
jgi:hypothetical protein